MCVIIVPRAGDLKKHIAAVHLKEEKKEKTTQVRDYNIKRAGDLKKHIKAFN